ncbi:MAG: MaoC family dehydratase [Pseudomonadota bacterium]
MSKLHWEDFVEGQVNEYGPRHVTHDEIVEFAREFDPQPFHLDDEAAKKTMFGGLAASGWHTCCLFMRMIADGFVNNSASMGAPGVDEVKWLMPVRPGDDLTLRATVLDTRASKSRPDMGFVRFKFEMLNASGAVVMILESSLMQGLRGADRRGAGA